MRARASTSAHSQQRKMQRRRGTRRPSSCAGQARFRTLPLHHHPHPRPLPRPRPLLALVLVRVVVVVVRVRVRVARTNEYTNENLHVPSTPRARTRRRRPRENERTEIRRSTNPRSTIRALDATARGAESAIDRGRRESRATRAMRERLRCERIDATERTNGSIDRVVASSRERVSIE